MKTRDNTDYSAVGCGFLTALACGAYIGLAVAVNAIMLPPITAYHTVESYVATPQIRTGKLVEKKHVRAPNLDLYVGKLELPTGEVVELTDESNIVEGKWMPNSVIGKMEVGKDYTFNSLDWMLGHKIMSAEEVK